MADIGQFNGSVFHSAVFDTGEAAISEEVLGPPDQDFRHYNQVMREDEEILAFILSTVTSGILEE